MINIDNEPVFDAELETQARAMKRKRIQRGASFTAEEGVLICESWIEVGTKEIIGAEQRGTTYWGRFTKRYNESRILPPCNIQAQRTETSISKRWLHIQSEMSKFCGSIENIQARPVSGFGVNELVCSSPSLPLFWFHNLILCLCRCCKLWRHSRGNTRSPSP